MLVYQLVSTRIDKKGPSSAVLSSRILKKRGNLKPMPLPSAWCHRFFTSSSESRSLDPSLDTKGTGMNWRDAQVRCSDFPYLADSKRTKGRDLPSNKSGQMVMHLSLAMNMACWLEVSYLEIMELSKKQLESHGCSIFLIKGPCLARFQPNIWLQLVIHIVVGLRQMFWDGFNEFEGNIYGTWMDMVGFCTCLPSTLGWTEWALLPFRTSAQPLKCSLKNL